MSLGRTWRRGAKIWDWVDYHEACSSPRPAAFALVSENQPGLMEGCNSGKESIEKKKEEKRVAACGFRTL